MSKSRKLLALFGGDPSFEAAARARVKPHRLEVAATVEAVHRIVSENVVEAYLFAPSEDLPADTIASLIAEYSPNTPVLWAAASLPKNVEDFTCIPAHGVPIEVLALQLVAVTSIHARIEKFSGDIDAASQHAGALEEWSRATERAVAEMLHEFKTPVAIVQGYCQNLLDRVDGELNPEQRTSVERIGTSTALLTNIIRRGQYNLPERPDQQKPQRVTQTSFKGGRTRFDVRELVREVASLFENISNEHAFRVEVSTGEEPRMMWGTRARLSQLFVNLIGNAERHTPPNGVIRLRIHDAAPDTLAIEVFNEGVPIRSDLLDKAFEEGVSFDGRSGLGLSICRGITQEHSGTITGRSEADGTTFKVTLPIDARGKRTPPVVALIPDADLAGQLVIEIHNRYGSVKTQGPTDMEQLVREMDSRKHTVVLAGPLPASLRKLLAEEAAE